MSTGSNTGGLRVIFSIFLGLVLAGFFGVGVYTFYPPPERPDGAVERAEAAQGQEEENEIYQDAYKAWGRTTGIVLIICATISMAVSLVRAEQLLVISNGLLLGGVFTMLYGIGWTIAADTSGLRLLVLTIALGITITLGHFKFVRRQSAIPEAPGAGDPDLAHRLAALEEKMEAMARALRD